MAILDISWTERIRIRIRKKGESNFGAEIDGGRWYRWAIFTPLASRTSAAVKQLFGSRKKGSRSLSLLLSLWKMYGLSASHWIEIHGFPSDSLKRSLSRGEKPRKWARPLIHFDAYERASEVSFSSLFASPQLFCFNTHLLSLSSPVCLRCFRKMADKSVAGKRAVTDGWPIPDSLYGLCSFSGRDLCPLSSEKGREKKVPEKQENFAGKSNSTAIFLLPFSWAGGGKDEFSFALGDWVQECNFLSRDELCVNPSRGKWWYLSFFYSSFIDGGGGI